MEVVIYEKDTRLARQLESQIGKLFPGALVRTCAGAYRKRFITKTGNKIQIRQVRDVAFFYADGKTVYLVIRNANRKFIIDHTLEELESTLDPDHFFRINRKQIVFIDSISEVRKLSTGKLDIKLNQVCDQEFAVSRERTREFKRWLNR